MGSSHDAIVCNAVLPVVADDSEMGQSHDDIIVNVVSGDLEMGTDNMIVCEFAVGAARVEELGSRKEILANLDTEVGTVIINTGETIRTNIVAPEVEKILNHTESVTDVKCGEGKQKAAQTPALQHGGAFTTGSKKQKRAKTKPESYKLYIQKVFKRECPGFNISSKAMSIVNSFLKDTFQKIATEASNLALNNQKATISGREIQTAVRLLLPGELAVQAILIGTEAVVRTQRE